MYQKYKENLYEMFDGSVKPIAELEGELYINLGISKNYEDSGSCTYSRNYKLIPYTAETEDRIHVQANNIRTFELRGTTNPLIERKDKIPFEVCGFSDDGEKQILTLQRKYPEKIVEPTK